MFFLNHLKARNVRWKGWKFQPLFSRSRSVAPQASSFFSVWFAGIRFAQLEVQVSTSNLQHFSVPWMKDHSRQPGEILGKVQVLWCVFGLGGKVQVFDDYLCNLPGFCLIQLLFANSASNVFPLACLEWDGLNISRFKSRSVARCYTKLGSPNRCWNFGHRRRVPPSQQKTAMYIYIYTYVLLKWYKKGGRLYLYMYI